MVFKFTIDSWVNAYVPRNQLYRLPRPIRRFLGAHSPKPQPDYLIWIEILVASFCGIALATTIFRHPTVFYKHHAPAIIASYGATAILCFNASQSPLAQPRNIFFGHFFSSLIGVCLQKLFALGSGSSSNYWACAGLSVGVSSVIMSVLNCVHPPAGASALLPCMDEQIREMGWWYLPAQIVSSLLMISAACITGNLLRKYPAYWWSPAETGSKWLAPTPSVEEKSPSPESDLEANVPSPKRNGLTFVEGLNSVEITEGQIRVPADFDDTELTTEWMELLQKLLRKDN